MIGQMGAINIIDVDFCHYSVICKSSCYQHVLIKLRDYEMCELNKIVHTVWK